jgi:hypothetical protein
MGGLRMHEVAFCYNFSQVATAEIFLRIQPFPSFQLRSSILLACSYPPLLFQDSSHVIDFFILTYTSLDHLLLSVVIPIVP